MGERGYADFSKIDSESLDLQKVFIRNETEILGFLELVKLNKPFPFYYLKQMDIYEEHQGQKHGKEFILQANKFLEESNMPGVLIDSIYSHTNPAKGMYERNGWQKLDYGEMYIYNPPPELSPEELKRLSTEIVINITPFV